MGVIQNSINQILTIAAAGSYLAPHARAKTKGVQEAMVAAAKKEETLKLQQARLKEIFSPESESYATVLKGKDVKPGEVGYVIHAQYEGLKGLEKQVGEYEKLGGDPNEIAGYRTSLEEATKGMKSRGDSWKNYEKERLIPLQKAQVSMATAQDKKSAGKESKPKTKGGKVNGTKSKSKQK